MTESLLPNSPVISRAQLNTMSMRQLADTLAPGINGTSVSRRWGVIMNISGNTVDVALGSVTVTGLAYLSWYVPTVGETVLVDVVSTDMVVVGATSPCMNQDFTTRNATITGTLTVAGMATFNDGITIPTGVDVTLTDLPVNPTDAANKAYIDARTPQMYVGTTQPSGAADGSVWFQTS